MIIGFTPDAFSNMTGTVAVPVPVMMYPATGAVSVNPPATSILTGPLPVTPLALKYATALAIVGKPGQPEGT